MKITLFKRSRTLLLFALFLNFTSYFYMELLLNLVGIFEGDTIFQIVRYIRLGLKGFFIIYLTIVNRDRLIKARLFQLVIFIYLLSGIISVLLNPQLLPIVTDFFVMFIANILPIILTLITASNSEELYRTLLTFSYMQVPLVIIYPFSYAYLQSGAYMTYGYTFMIFWGFILLKKNKNLCDHLILTLWVILYIIFANRGALFCMVGIYFIYLIVFTPIKRKVYISTLISAVGIMLMLFGNSITSSLASTFSKENIASRTIQLILSGDFLSTSGRDYLYDNAIRLIKNNPFGYGLGFDRLAAVEIGMSPIYVHNIFLELLLDFGIIAGTFIIVTILGVGLFVLFSKNRFSEPFRKVFAVLYVMGLILLLASASIFESIYLSSALLVILIKIENWNESWSWKKR